MRTARGYHQFSWKEGKEDYSREVNKELKNSNLLWQEGAKGREEYFGGTGREESICLLALTQGQAMHRGRKDGPGKGHLCFGLNSWGHSQVGGIWVSLKEIWKWDLSWNEAQGHGGWGCLRETNAPGSICLLSAAL